MGYVRVRFYTLKTGKLAEAIQSVEAGTAPLLRRQAGFLQYFVARTGLDQMMSVSLWDTQAHLDAAEVRLGEWLDRNIGDIIVSAEQHVGEVTFMEALNVPPEPTAPARASEVRH